MMITRGRAGPHGGCVKRLERLIREWERSIPNVPPPDRGWLFWFLTVSDPEIRSAVRQTAVEVRMARIRTTSHAHRHCGSLIRKMIDGREADEDPDLTAPAWRYASPLDAKKPVSSHKRNDVELSTPETKEKR